MDSIPLRLYLTTYKGIPREAEVALGVPGRLRPRIFSTFGTTRVGGRQPNAPAAFTPGGIPGTHFQRLSRPQGTWFCRKEARKKSPVTPPGIDPGTFRLVAQRLNHYPTPGPIWPLILPSNQKHTLLNPQLTIFSPCISRSRKWPCLRFMYRFLLRRFTLRWEFLSPWSSSQTPSTIPPLVVCPQMLIQYLVELK
jgi:hypothetical protein